MKPPPILHEFNPEIYPLLLWVAIGTDKFEDKLEDAADFRKGNLAQSECCVSKGKNKFGVLIRFKRKNLITAMSVAHESTHAALFILDDLGVKYDCDNSEQLAYLIGWIADCCWKVRNFKKKKQ